MIYNLCSDQVDTIKRFGEPTPITLTGSYELTMSIVAKFLHGIYLQYVDNFKASQL